MLIVGDFNVTEVDCVNLKFKSDIQHYFKSKSIKFCFDFLNQMCLTADLECTEGDLILKQIGTNWNNTRSYD